MSINTHQKNNNYLNSYYTCTEKNLISVSQNDLPANIILYGHALHYASAILSRWNQKVPKRLAIGENVFALMKEPNNFELFQKFYRSRIEKIIQKELEAFFLCLLFLL
jgi:hypothetical protein